MVQIDALTGVILATYTTGGVFLMVSDGSNIWGTRFIDATVRKTRISDGANLGVFALPSAGYTEGIAFDGANIWACTDVGVFKLALDGTIVGQFHAGTDSFLACLFDGVNIWCIQNVDNFIHRFALDGTLLNSFPCGGTGGQQISFDGTFLWIGNITANTVTKMALDGTIIGSYPTGSIPDGVAFDGTNIWVVNQNDGTVTVFDPATGTVLGTSPFVTAGPEFLAYGGSSASGMWASGIPFSGPGSFAIRFGPASAPLPPSMILDPSSPPAYVLPFCVADSRCEYQSNFGKKKVFSQ